MKKSSSLEDYMKCILVLSKKNGTVRSVDVAEKMGITKPSVSNAMKKLREQNMICVGDEGNIILTDEGRSLAEKVYGKHSLLSKLLRSVGVNKDTADKEACAMEHAISDDTFECLEEYMNKSMRTSSEDDM